MTRRPPARHLTARRPAVARPLAWGVLSAVALGAACAPAARVVPDPAPAPAGDAWGARAVDPRGGTSAGNLVPVAFLAGASAGAARWAGTYAAGDARPRALTLRLTDGGGGALGGELTLLVAPRASTFAGGRGQAPLRVQVPLARGRYAAGRLVLDTEAYYDAGCECTVAGTFRAAVRGDTLVGTYATRGAATAGGVRGRWRAVRAPDRP